MINVALVGYREFPMGGGEDLIVSLPQMMASIESLPFRYSYTEIVEDRNENGIKDCVHQMRLSEPDVLHYANYRDIYTGTKNDEDYIREVLATTKIPILLTCGQHNAADEFVKSIGIESVGIEFLTVPFSSKEYIDKIVELAQRRSHDKGR